MVRTGRPAAKVNKKQGAEFFAEFVESLFPFSFPAASALGRHLGVPNASAPMSVLDIGAGSGVWGIALAKQSPYVRIHAVDWPQVMKVTRRVAEKHGLANRLSTAAGDFFEADFRCAIGLSARVGGQTKMRQPAKSAYSNQRRIWKLETERVAADEQMLNLCYTNESWYNSGLE